MKIALNHTQNKEYLNKADQIIFRTYNASTIENFIKQYPDKTFIIIIPREKYVDIVSKEFAYNIKVISEKVDLHLGLPLLTQEMCDLYKQLNIKFFYNYSISSYYEYNALVRLGVSYIYIIPPILFDFNFIKEHPGALLRMTPNIACDGYIPTFNSAHGGWIRPEDLHYYKDIIDVIEFLDCDIRKEQALFRIYKEEHEWPGKLNMLFSNLPYNIENSALPRDFGQVRLNCKQKCESIGTCHYCDNSLAFGISMKKYADEIFTALNQIKENNKNINS